MPELQFKGKEFVYNHHLTVPYRPLVPAPDKSIGDGTLKDNLIVHGDNLHALKALMPLYAGKVDCVFIDPPYNTGNENWNYNDNVNSPLIREWLDGNPVNKEDMLRHDKWLCMMYPRLRLLWELLAETGSFWMTLDDNEVHHARAVLDEIFGEANFIATCIWHKNYSPKNTAQFFSEDHDYLIIYAKNKSLWRPNLLARTEEMEARYTNPDNDPRGPWKPSDVSARNYYSEGTYPITTPSGRFIKGPPRGTYWRVKKEKFDALDRDGRIWWGEDGSNIPAIKRFRSEVKQGKVPQTLWEYDDVGHTQDAKKELLSILHFDTSESVFVTPKPHALLRRIIDIATDEDSILLDSFAGSGTTAHAVLSANFADNGNRRFILVESQEYADSLTAERARKVIRGYEYTGTQREELFRQKLTLRHARNPESVFSRIGGIENLEKHRFDRVVTELENGVLYLFGEKDVEGKTDGLGGTFTFATLGEALDLDRLLTGHSMPDFATIGAWLYHTATGESFSHAGHDEGTGFLGESSSAFVWLIYRPDLSFLQSKEAVLTLTVAERIAATKRGKRHLVFAAAKFVPNALLRSMGIDFAQLPFAVYRIDKD